MCSWAVHTLLFFSFFFFLASKSLDGFSTNHPTKVRARLPGSMSTYRRLMRSLTNGVLTLTAGIEPASLWDTNLFLTNCANSHWFVHTLLVALHLHLARNNKAFDHKVGNSKSKKIR